MMRAEHSLRPAKLATTVPNVKHGDPSFRFYPVTIVRNGVTDQGLICQQNRDYSPHLLNKPVQLPCGHRFCQVTCWEPNLFLQQELCRRPEVVCPDPDCHSVFLVDEVFSDKYIVRDVNSLDVHCLNQAKGCHWNGDLATLKRDHIHECNFARVVHDRPDSADPHELATMFSNLLTVQDNAQNQMHACHCMIRHCQEQIRLLIKSSGITQSDMTKFDEIECRITNAEQNLNSHLTSFKHHLLEHQDQLAAFVQRLERLERANAKINPAEICQNGIYVWKISNFYKYVDLSKRSKLVYASSFYQEKYGYKLCAKIHINDVATNTSKGLGISLCILRGEYDNLLRWPFNREIQVRLLDQGVNHEHLQLRFCYDPDKPDYYQKPTGTSNQEIPLKWFSGQVLKPAGDDGVQYVSSDGQLFLQFEVPNNQP